MVFDHMPPVNQNSSVQPWESCLKTRVLGLTRPWVTIWEGGPEILKIGVT